MNRGIGNIWGGLEFFRQTLSLNCLKKRLMNFIKSIYIYIYIGEKTSAFKFKFDLTWFTKVLGSPLSSLLTMKRTLIKLTQLKLPIGALVGEFSTQARSN